MTTVQTVRGPVDVAELGTTLMHEHIVILEPEALANYGRVWGEPYWEEERGVANAIAKLQRARDGGIRTIVDPTAPGLGRDITRIQRINAAVDLHIVVASGLYTFLGLTEFLAMRDDDVLTEIFVREIREGINDTGVRAAFLKCAVEAHGIAGDVPRVLRAVAAASLETAAPIMVHTNAEHRTGLPALEALTGHGVDPRKIVIAHCGDSNDLDYLRAIADTGAWLGLDRFKIEHFNPDADRVATLLALIEAGYAGQIHLGHDASTFYDFMHRNPPFAGERPDYLWITNAILPRLREAGVTDTTIPRLLVDNPLRFFS
jgi:phosphotriesterase-related protein